MAVLKELYLTISTNNTKEPFMRSLLLPLLLLNLANAAESPLHNTSFYLIILFLILFIMSLFAFYVRKCNHKDSQLQEKDKNIIALHEQHAAQEKESIQMISQKEQEILTLNHNITNLERTVHEGSKNQVVAKIEALQKKRQNIQRDASNT